MMENFVEPRADSTRRPMARRLAFIAPAAGFLLFFAAVFASGMIGVEMARNHLPSNALESSSALGERAQIGSPSDPTYLGGSADSVRRFFAAHPTPEARSAARLPSSGIRRVVEPIEVSIEGVEADTLEIRINSGALSGTVHWIHHSQIQAPLAFDPVISPLPLENP